MGMGLIPTHLCDTPHLVLTRDLLHMHLEAYVMSRQIAFVRSLEEQEALFLTLDMSIRLANELMISLSSNDAMGVLLDNCAVAWPYEVSELMKEGDIHAQLTSEEPIESIHSTLWNNLPLCAYFSSGVPQEMAKQRIKQQLAQICHCTGDEPITKVGVANKRRLARRRRIGKQMLFYVSGTTRLSDDEEENSSGSEDDASDSDSSSDDDSDDEMQAAAEVEKKDSSDSDSSSDDDSDDQEMPAAPEVGKEESSESDSSSDDDSDDEEKQAAPEVIGERRLIRLL